MSTEIQEYAITFGVQYGRRPDDDRHPLGMFADGYAVIEAPDGETARKIAFAVFGQQWAFDYPLSEFLREGSHELSRRAGELLRIAWQTPEMVERILESMKSIVEGHPAEEVSVQVSGNRAGAFTPPDMPAELYNELVTHLLAGGTRDGILLAGKIQNLFGAGARRRQEAGQ